MMRWDDEINYAIAKANGYPGSLEQQFVSELRVAAQRNLDRIRLRRRLLRWALLAAVWLLTVAAVVVPLEVVIDQRLPVLARLAAGLAGVVVSTAGLVVLLEHAGLPRWRR